MLVTRSNLQSVVNRFKDSEFIALDTETTGLRAYHGDRLFSLIMCDENGSVYFNFKEYAGLDSEWVLPREETWLTLQNIFAATAKTWFIHNAKFDLTMLHMEGVSVAGKIHDTEVCARLLYNRHLDYSLSAVAKRYGEEKSEEVEEYIAEHKLFTWIKSPGKEKREKWPHYDRVPFSIISRYGEQDGRITYAIGQRQRREIAELPSVLGEPAKKLASLYEEECTLVKTCLAMELRGIRVDLEYCRQAYEAMVSEATQAADEFSKISGMPFIDSNKELAKAFTAVGEKYPLTEKGNPSFTDEILSGFSSPLAKLLQRYRAASKKANTYFANFLHYADNNGRIHPNMRQAGTETGRFSYSSPNLQNCPKEEEGDWKVRRAFIPADGFFFASLDYDQQEYRLMLDYAGQMDVIEKVRGGLDVHTATGQAMGVERTPAKTLNFLLIYGGGAGKLAAALGIPLSRSRALRQQYFSRLPAVKKFIRRVMDTAKLRGFIFNWAGRICHFPEVEIKGEKTRFEYVAPNHLIQGGGADVIKRALNRVEAYLQDWSSRLVLTVHDELLVECAYGEEHVLPEIKRIMEASYPARHLKLTCGLDICKGSWAHKERAH